MAELRLEEMYNLLSLFESENKEIEVDEELLAETISKGERCLIVSLLTNRHYNREAFKQTMKKVGNQYMV